MKSRMWMLTAALGLALALPAAAQDSSTAGALEVQANFQFAGVRLPVTGDDDADATVDLELRAPGGDWRPAHPLLRTAGGLFTGSLFFLTPDTAYEARATLRDPDNATEQAVEIAFRTRANPVLRPPAPTELFVAPDGDDGGPGTSDLPLATVSEAASRAAAGTLIHVGPGVYREAVTLTTSGAPGNPIALVGEAGAVLDGSEPALAAGQAVWTLLEDDIYWTPFAGECRYAAWGEQRLYDYTALDDLRAETGGQAGQTGVLPGGFFVDGGAGRLYLRLPDRTDPNGQPIHAAVLPGGFLLDGAHDVVVEGFEIRFYGTVEYSGFGVDVRASDHALVRSNYIHNLNSGVRVRRGASACLIENNRIEDTSVWGWPWDSVKAHEAEASGISLSGGPGCVARRNTIQGPFNGIYVGEFSDTPDPLLAAETDVHDNTIRQTGDDGLEPEGACANVRFVDNLLDGAHNSVSLSPIQLGPTWLVNNRLLNFKAHALKLNNGSSGPILVYHTTSHPTGGAVDAQAWAPSLPFGPLWGRNNVWAAHRYVIEYGLDSLLGPVDIDFDLLFTDRSDGGPLLKWLNLRYDTLAAFTADTALEAHGWNEAPQYENPAGGDFRPAAGGSLVDRGEVIAGINDSAERVPDGRPDLGALERGGSLPPDAGQDDGSDGSAADADADGGPDAGVDAGGDEGADAGSDPDAGDGQATDGGDGGGSLGGSCGCSPTGAGNPTELGGLFFALVLLRRRSSPR